MSAGWTGPAHVCNALVWLHRSSRATCTLPYDDLQAPACVLKPLGLKFTAQPPAPGWRNGLLPLGATWCGATAVSTPWQSPLFLLRENCRVALLGW